MALLSLLNNIIKKITLKNYYFYLVFISIVIVGCSVNKRDTVLSFLLDDYVYGEHKELLTKNDSVAVQDSIAIWAYSDSLEKANIQIIRDSKARSHPPFYNQECQRCHKMVDLYSENKGLSEPQSETCYKCHEAFDETYTSLHAPVAAGKCTVCHRPHHSKNKKLLIQKGRALCFNCHNEKRLLALNYHATIKNANCIECHHPHGTKSEGNTTLIKDGICTSCHQDVITSYNYLHGPVNVGECTTCHGQHSLKTDFNLLRESNETCFYCHNSSTISMNKTHNANNNKSCIECHNPHGKVILADKKIKDGVPPTIEIKDTLADNTMDSLKPLLELDLATMIVGTTKEEDQLIANTFVILIDEEDNIIDSTKTNPEGRFYFDILPSDKVYLFVLDIADTSLYVDVEFKSKDETTLENINSVNNKNRFIYKDFKTQIQPKVFNKNDIVQITGVTKIGSNVIPDKVIFLLDKNDNIIDSSWSNRIGQIEFNRLPSDKSFLFMMSKEDEELNVTIEYIDKYGEVIKTINSSLNKDKFIYKKLDSLKPDEPIVKETTIADDNTDLDPLLHKEMEQLKPSNMIAGRIIADDEMISNTLVVLVDEKDNVIDSVRSDKKGHFYFNILPSDKVYLFVIDKDDEKIQVEVEYKDKDGKVIKEVNSSNDKDRFLFKELTPIKHSVDLIKEEDILIAGTTKKEKVSIANTLVILTDESNNIIDSTRTDATGRFYFKNLPSDKNFLFMLDKDDIGLRVKLEYLNTEGKVLQEINSNDDKDQFLYQNLAQLPHTENNLGEYNLQDNSTIEKTNNNDLINELEFAAIKSVHFDFDKIALFPDAYITLNNLIKILKKLPESVIEISGHTDAHRDVERAKRIFKIKGIPYSKEAHDKMSSEYNQKLSQKRAQFVSNYMIRKGINRKKLVIKGYGEYDPIAPNVNPDGTDNPKGRDLNRRVEFKIISKNK
jgi:predicted CXXCH cytochrome family protein